MGSIIFYEFCPSHLIQADITCDFRVCLLGQKEDKTGHRASGLGVKVSRALPRGGQGRCPGPEAWGRGVVKALSLLFLRILPSLAVRSARNPKMGLSMFCSFYTRGKITQ